ncbi:MAG: hypothetical protein COA78_34310 [Blastopirellula sp.]|nr:MAG: hypothetical protein COA78_34310 [Blastopirellula sp.]
MLYHMTNILNQPNATIIEFGTEHSELSEISLRLVSPQIIGAIKLADPPRFVYDLSSATIISSHFIRLLIKTWKLAISRGGDIVLVGVKDDCLDELERLKIDSLWKRFESRDEAVASFSGKRKRM